MKAQWVVALIAVEQAGGGQQQRPLADRGDIAGMGALPDEEVQIDAFRIAHQPDERVGLSPRHP